MTAGVGAGAADPRARSGHGFVLLDGLRGVAAILVVMRHAPGLFGIAPAAVETHLAVDLFFVLSGFVLAHAYERRIRDGLSAAAFLRIRIVRLYPLYALGLGLSVAAALLSFAIGQGPGFSGLALAATALCAALILPTPSAVSTMPGAIFPLNYPAWSIFFELVINMGFFYGLAALSVRRLHAFVALCLAGLGAVALHHGDLDAGYYWSEIHAGLLRVGFAFPVGVLLHRRWSRHPRTVLGTGPALACLGVLTILLVLPVPAGAKAAYDLVVAALAFPALVYAAASVVPGPRLAQACLWAGAASYPLYILHAPALTWLEAVGRRMPWPALALPAPWSGIVFLVALTAASLVLLRVFDAPLRRRLSAPQRPAPTGVPSPAVELS